MALRAHAGPIRSERAQRRMPLRTTPTSFIEKGSKAVISERQNEVGKFEKIMHHKDEQKIFAEG